MATYIIETEQRFLTSYRVEADSPDEAWDNFIIHGDGECIEQIPENITGTRESAVIEIES